MGILLVYDVTNQETFQNIRNWMRNIEENAAETVNKVGSNSEPPQRTRLLHRSRFSLETNVT